MVEQSEISIFLRIKKENMYSEIENSKSSWLDINQNEVESADKIYNTLLLQNILRYKTKKKD